MAGRSKRIVVALEETADDDAHKESDETDEKAFFHNNQVLLKILQK